MKTYTIEYGKFGRFEKWIVVMEDFEALHTEIVCLCYKEKYAEKILKVFQADAS